MGKGEQTVEKSTAGEIHIHQSMLLSPCLLNLFPKSVICDHAQNLTEFTVLNQLPDLDAQWEISRPDGFHKEQVLLFCCSAENLRLLRIHCERLLAQDVLPSFQTEHCVLEVMGVRRCNVDDINVVVGDQFSIRSVGGAGRWNFAVLNELFGTALGRRGGDGGNIMSQVVNGAGGGVDKQISNELWERMLGKVVMKKAKRSGSTIGDHSSCYE